MAHIVLAVIAFIAVCSAQKEQTRWSRQISSYTSDIGDWVPLKVPVESELPQIKRQAVAEPRILSEPFPGFTRPTGFSQDEFESRAYYNPPANRHLYLQSVPSAPQNYLSDQGFNQGLRFGLAQPNYPLSQGFIMPQFNFDGVPQFKPRPQIISNPVKFENVPKMRVPVTNPIKQFANQAPKLKPETPKFVDGYRLENTSSNFLKKKPQSPQKIKFETDKSREILTAPKPNLEREEVQLLYVPLESLNRGQFNFKSPLTSAQLLNTELYNQNTRSNPVQSFSELQNPMLKQVDNFNSQEYLANYSPIREINPAPKFSTTTQSIPTPFPIASPTTPKPKKLKPHQPPLAIFLTQDAKKDDQVKVGDVLYTLKNANTVAVLDSVNPLNAPSVFIGPSSLTPPENYVKFELPYLSNIENTDKKLRQLPFFVAPLSYNTPQGFAKIPFPSPHVGSVVINSQMKDTSTAIKAKIIPEVYTNSFLRPTSYRPVQKPVTQKPVISYYTTSTPTINSPNYEQNYYSIEPQAVNSLPSSKEQETKLISQQPSPIKTGSYFLHNIGNQQQYSQYNHQQFVNFPQENNYKTQETPRTVNVIKTETTTTQQPRTTVSTTTVQTPPTYPNQLLETHNPYSINQAFSFSTPLDYHNFFDEYKEPYVTPGSNQPPPSSTLSANPRKPEKSSVNEQSQQSPPNQMNLYSPEIHHLPENHNLRYPVFNTNDYFTTTEPPRTEVTYSNNPGQINENTQTITNFQTNVDYNDKLETQSPTYANHTHIIKNEQISQGDIQTTKETPEYNQFDINNNSQETLDVGDSNSSSSSTSTTTTKRTTLRSRARPRYPLPKPDSSEYSTRSTVTRRPLRERKTLPPRSRYESNKITTERVTRKPVDVNESTTKSTRYRTRGRVQFKPSDADEFFSKKNKQGNKEQDLAYQRDVLHQNYPVTLMERTSTVDIEAITEPSDKDKSSNNQESTNTKIDDTEDAYSSDKISITDNVNGEFKDLPPQYTTAEDSQTGASYVPNLPVHNEEFFYQPKTSELPQETGALNEETKQKELFSQSSVEKSPAFQDTVVATTSSMPITEEYVHEEYQNYETPTVKPEELTTLSENERNMKSNNHETVQEQEQEDNIVETTPSYNRVRVRPGVIRKYHQSSSSDLSRTKTDKRKPLQPITYRPAFDRRRTTMRIEEIEADLKTKQIRTRTEFQNYRQPVYKPEPSTESSITSTTESSTKRSQFRRRRPSYGTTSTESTISRRPYEGKNRFRGRRPSDKTTEKTELQSEMTTTTMKNTIHNRYANRPRLSERYNKNPEVEEPTAEDQDPNYSINIPRYMEPESNGWSPKISQESFKPYNPNDIPNEPKASTPENKSNNEELDIITAKNEYEDIFISVTPATNNRLNKKLPEVPPTLEALVLQSKATKGNSGNAVSTFETMLEEVMKSLEEQDENEYTNKVIKHKGGEIGEIPPERIISSGENYSAKTTSPQEESTTQQDNITLNEDDAAQKNRRRGFWKKVKVRPAKESIDVAESQYYSKIVNHLGQSVSKNSLEKSRKDSTKLLVTTYKPDYHFLKDFFESEEDHDGIPDIEITKITENKSEILDNVSTKPDTNDNFTEKLDPGEIDLGTGAPDPTYDDSTTYFEPTEPTPSDSKSIDRSDGFSFMDYLFGVTSTDREFKNESKIIEKDLKGTTKLPSSEAEIGTEATKLKATTESEYLPYEFTADSSATEIDTEKIPSNDVSDDVRSTERALDSVENSSKSSFMDPANVVSTSMSTEVSHETEICFRGKCIKTNKDESL